MSMAEHPGTINEQWEKPVVILPVLTKQVISLPKKLPKGSPDSPITHYFANLSFEEDEGQYHSIDLAWTCTFKGTDAKKETLVLGGQYGLHMIYTYLSFFLKQPGIKENNRLNLMDL
jgi:hypothetical protein